MIIYTQAYLLSELAAAVPLTHARIGYQSFTQGATPDQVTASSETESGPSDAPLRPDTGEYWEPSSMPATWEFDLGSAEEINYVGIAGHTLGSAGAAIEVQAGADDEVDSNGNYPVFAQAVNPANDRPLLFLDDDRIARRLRIVLTGATAPKIAVVYVGMALKMQRALFGGHAPVPLSRMAELSRSLSKGGQFLGQRFRRRGVMGTAHYGTLTSDWYRENFDPFVEHAQSLPYFFAWRPSRFPEEVAYVWTPEPISPRNVGGGRDHMEVEWQMFGLGDE